MGDKVCLLLRPTCDMIRNKKRGCTMPKKDEQLAIQRRYKVFKSNEIIKASKSDFTLKELKVLSFLISMIKRGDSIDKIYEFNISDYWKIAGITKSGKNNKDIKACLQVLRDKSFWIADGNNKEYTVSWLSKVWIDNEKNKAQVRFDEDIQRYIMGVYDDFSAWSLLYELPMASKYSIILYELAKSYALQGKHKFTLDELKYKLGATNYTSYKDFRRRALDVAKKEINNFTDIHIEYEPDYKGRKVVAIEIIITKRDARGIWRSDYYAEHLLDGQMTLEEIAKEREMLERKEGIK